MGICNQCNEQGKTLIHHRDFNHGNDVATNRVELCYYCHAQAHLPAILERNRVKREAAPGYGIDKSKPGWSEGMTWDELLDARGSLGGWD